MVSFWLFEPKTDRINTFKLSSALDVLFLVQYFLLSMMHCMSNEKNQISKSMKSKQQKIGEKDTSGLSGFALSRKLKF